MSDGPEDHVGSKLVGPGYELNLGIRRDADNLDGSKYTGLPPNNPLVFKTENVDDGKIRNISEAAGSENMKYKAAD